MAIILADSDLIPIKASGTVAVPLKEDELVPIKAKEPVKPEQVDSSTLGAIGATAIGTTLNALPVLGKFTQNMVAPFPAGIAGVADAAVTGVSELVKGKGLTEAGSKAADALVGTYNRVVGELAPNVGMRQSDVDLADKATELALLVPSSIIEYSGKAGKTIGETTGEFAKALVDPTINPEEWGSKGQLAGEYTGDLLTFGVGAKALNKAANTPISALAKRRAGSTMEAIKKAEAMPANTPQEVVAKSEALKNANVVATKAVSPAGTTPVPITDPTSGNRLRDKRAKQQAKAVADQQTQQENFARDTEVPKVEAPEVAPATDSILNDPATQDVVLQNVKSLGSEEAVRALYKTDSPLDIFARELAKTFYEQKAKANEPPKPVTPEVKPAEVATESTSVHAVNEGQPVEVPKTETKSVALTPEQWDELRKADWLTDEELAALAKAPDYIQQDRYRILTGKKTDTIIDPQDLAKAQEAAARIEANGRMRQEYMRDVATLKNEGFSKEEIKKFQDEGTLSKKASELRGELQQVDTSARAEAKLTELEQLTRNIADMRFRGEEIPPDVLNMVVDKIADTGMGEVIDPLTKYKMFDSVDPDTGFTNLSYGEFRENLNRIRKSWDTYFRENRRSKKGTVRETITEDMVDEGTTERPTEQPKERNRRDRSETRSRLEGPDESDWSGLTADQIEERLSAEGTPAELEFAKEKKKGDKANDTTADIIEKSAEAKRKFDAVVKHRKVFNGDKEAKDTIVRGYKFNPANRTEALAHLAMLEKAEAMAETHIPAKKMAYSKKTIAQAITDGKLSKLQAKYVETIISALRKQPDFELDFTKDMDGLRGVYALADNLMKIQDVKATAHEVMHWAFYNVLSGQERLAYYRDYVNQFYAESGRKKTIKVLMATTDPFNAKRNPSEMFAARGSDIANMTKLTQVERTLFQTVFGWFKKIAEKFTGNVKLGEIDKLFDKVMDDTQRTEWNDTNEAASVRHFITGEANESSIWKPTEKKSDVTLDSMGLQSIYERTVELVKILRAAKRPTIGNKVLAELHQDGGGFGWDPTQVVFTPAKDISVLKKAYDGLRNPFRSPVMKWEGTILERPVFNLNLAENYYYHMYTQHSITLRDIEHGLNDASKVRITKYLREVMNNKTSDIQLNAQEAQAALDVRSWLDLMRNKYKVSMLTEWKNHLGKSEYNALLDIISGAKVEDVALKYPRLATSTVLEIAHRYKAIDSWGLDDYIPNVELGKYKITHEERAKDGTVYRKLAAVALSEKDAVRKALAIAQERPDVSNFYIDTDFKNLVVDKTGVTAKQWYGMVNSLAKALKENIAGIDAEAKRIAEKTLSRKFNINPGDVFSEFTLDRQDMLKGEDNIFPVLHKYAYNMEKKMALDQVIDQVKGQLGKMTTEERAWIINYIDEVKGKYGTLDRKLDGIMSAANANLNATSAWLEKKSGMHVPSLNLPEGRTFSRLSGAIRTGEAYIKLGYRPIAAAINAVSGQGHTWVKVGTKYMIDGKKFLDTPEGQAFFTSVEPYLGVSIVEMGATDVKTTLHPLNPLKMFQAAEPFNRKECVAANYLYAKNELKMSPQAAREFAIRANMTQQFTYNMANLPDAMRGPVGKVILQFKPYLFKELEFMGTLTAKEWMRYSAMQLALGGPRGAVMILKSIPILALMPWWDDAMDNIEQYMNTNYPVLSRGVAAIPSAFSENLGVDITAAATFQFPQSATDLMGPFFSDMTKIFKNVIGPVMENGVFYEDIKKAADISPILKSWWRLWDFMFSKDNWIRDERGNKLYEVPNTWAFILQSLSGAEGTEVSRMRLANAIEAREDARITNLKQRLVNSYLRQVAKGVTVSEEEMARLWKYVTPQGVLHSTFMKNLPPAQRLLLQTELRRRPEFLEVYPMTPSSSAPVE